MDDPTRRCENDTGNGTRLLGAPGPKREPHFFVRRLRFDLLRFLLAQWSLISLLFR
jgi:hypothetical protein